VARKGALMDWCSNVERERGRSRSGEIGKLIEKLKKEMENKVI